MMINTNAQVINMWKQIVRGLLAAGEITGGINGSNRLGKSANVECNVLGKTAGYNAPL